MSESPKYIPIPQAALPGMLGKKVHWSKARSTKMHWTLKEIGPTHCVLSTNAGKCFTVRSDELIYTIRHRPT